MDVVELVGSRDYDVRFDERFLVPDFAQATVTATLGGDVSLGTQSVSCGEEVPGLAIPMRVEVVSDDASVTLSNTVFVFAPSAEASALTWAGWRPFLDEGSASVPDAYLQYPEGEPGVSIDPDRPTVSIIDEILAPGVNLGYRGTSDGEEGIFPVFQAWLTPR